MSKINFLEEENRRRENSVDIKSLNEKMKNLESDVDELQWRSLTNNITISGIKLEPNTDAENAVKQFIRTKLDIQKDINFVKVHTFGKKRKNGQKLIVAKFVLSKDKDLVMRNCHKLKGTRISVREQFPKKIETKRKQLYPVLQKAKKEKKKAILVRDQLFIEGKLFIPDCDIESVHTRHLYKDIRNRIRSDTPAERKPPINLHLEKTALPSNSATKA